MSKSINNINAGGSPERYEASDALNRESELGHDSRGTSWVYVMALDDNTKYIKMNEP